MNQKSRAPLRLLLVTDGSTLAAYIRSETPTTAGRDRDPRNQVVTTVQPDRAQRQVVIDAGRVLPGAIGHPGAVGAIAAGREGDDAAGAEVRQGVGPGEGVEDSPMQAWVIGAAGWFVPGAGHLLQGRWGRAVLLGGAVWACFLAGVLMGGHLFSVTGSEQGLSALLQIPPTIANLGAGALYVVCWLMKVGFADDPQHAALATFEYGNTFLLVAGLLNYLVMLDAFDISVGRKS